MIPVVNDRYRYILLYNPKAACTYIRKLYVDIHQEDFSAAEKELLRDWQTLNRVRPVDLHKDYSDYFTFTLVRHPYTRFVSAYLNRVAGAHKECHAEIAAFFKKNYGEDYPITYSFNQCLECIAETDHYLNNVHFEPQSYCSPSAKTTPYHQPSFNWRRLFKFLGMRTRVKSIHVDQVCKMENLSEEVASAYAKIFSEDAEKFKQVSEHLEETQLFNISFTQEELIPNAGDLSFDDLQKMVKKPNYESFLSDDAIAILNRKYESDFTLFNYAKNLAQVKAFEQQKHDKIHSLIPDDFDPQQYLNLNPDLEKNGVESLANAISHWVQHGRFENRSYK